MAKAVGTIGLNSILNYHSRVLKRVVLVFNCGTEIFLNGTILLLKQTLIFTPGFLWFIMSVKVLNHFKLFVKLEKERCEMVVIQC